MIKLGECRELTSRDGAVVKVRRLEQSDKRALQRFNDELSDVTRSKFLPHRYDEATVTKVVERSEAGEDLVLGVFNGDRMVGYFFLWNYLHRVPLLGIGLLDDFQGRGLGRKMMEMLIESGVMNRNEGIELTTLASNENAIALYEKVGFRHIGDVENLVGDGQTDVERAMFYEIKPGALTMEGKHQPPV